MLKHLLFIKQNKRNCRVTESAENQNIDVRWTTSFSDPKTILEISSRDGRRTLALIEGFQLDLILF